MVNDVIRLKNLNMEELAGVVSIYPWYAGAREEMCRRMAALGPDAWSEEKYAEYSLYLNSRRTVYDLVHGKPDGGYADSSASAAELPAAAGTPSKTIRDILVVGGDYFSREEYAKVHEESDDRISFCGVPHTEAVSRDYSSSAGIEDICTETLAQIYAEQGYIEQAKSIYSRLSLLYPEKNAYFAALIDKIENKTI